MSSGAYILLDSSSAPAPPPTPAPSPTLTLKLPETLAQTIRYDTDVTESDNGLENRASINEYPRETWELSYVLSDYELEEVRRALFQAPHVAYYIPAPHESLEALADITGATVSVNTTNADFPAAGDTVVVFNDIEQAYPATVLSVAPGTPGVNTVTLDQTPTGGQTYSKGSRLMPLRPCYLADHVTLRRYQANLGILAITAEVAGVRKTWGTGATLTTFQGRPVITAKPIMGGDQVEDQVLGGNVVFDFGSAFHQTTFKNNSDILRSHTFAIESDADRQYLYKLVQAAQGRRGSLYMATWRDNLVASIATPAPGATTLLITSDHLYATTWFVEGVVDLQLLHTDGSVEYAHVTAAVDNGNGTQSLTVASGLTGLTIAQISFLELARLASDEIAIAWDGHRAIVNLPIMRVQR